MKTFKYFIFFVLMANVMCAAAWAEEFQRYEIKASVDAEQKKLHAQQKVVYTNNSPDTLSEIFFHIYPNRQYTQKEKDFIYRFASYFKVNFFPDGFESGAIRFTTVEAAGQSVT